VARFLYGGDEAGLKLSLLFIMTEDGIPCIYYGTEQGLSGGNDQANREDMWLTGFNQSGSLYQWTRKLTRLRKAYPALRRGDQLVVWASERFEAEPDAGIFAYERTGGDAGDSYALIVLNAHQGHESRPVDDLGALMTVTAPPGTVLVDVLSPNGASYTVGSTGELDITLPPQSGALLIPQGDVVGGI